MSERRAIPKYAIYRMVGHPETDPIGLLGRRMMGRKRQPPRNACRAGYKRSVVRSAPRLFLKSLREPSLQELSQLRRRPELRNGIKLLERRRERIGQAPDRP